MQFNIWTYVFFNYVKSIEIFHAMATAQQRRSGFRDPKKSRRFSMTSGDTMGFSKHVSTTKC